MGEGECIKTKQVNDRYIEQPIIILKICFAGKLQSAEMEEILSMGETNKNSFSSDLRITEEAERKIDSYYEKFNNDLVELLQDDSFIWKNNNLEYK